eukprot:6185238-Pleurochrysis_carterae.AAC.1
MTSSECVKDPRRIHRSSRVKEAKHNSTWSADNQGARFKEGTRWTLPAKRQRYVSKCQER